MTTVEPREIVPIELSVNGEQVSRSVPARLLLVDFLRDTLDLTGTHVGCEHGICGACTILIDGEPARSCCTLAVQADGCELTTIEGLTPAAGLTEMQEAFRSCHGLQCGFCTPGFIVTLSALDPSEHPDDDAIREAISGNLCRCTGYDGIVRARLGEGHPHPLTRGEWRYVLLPPRPLRSVSVLTTRLSNSLVDRQPHCWI